MYRTTINSFNLIARTEKIRCMRHKIRLTEEKIKALLSFMRPKVYRKRMPLPTFRHIQIAENDVKDFVVCQIDDSNWPIIQPLTYWGTWEQRFVLRSNFTLPETWAPEEQTAILLSLGDANDFCNPESLVYLDGKACAACDKYHTEIYLPATLRDGKTHTLAIDTWTGRINWPRTGAKLFMGQSEIVQIDRLTRDFITLASIASETAAFLRDNNPAKGFLLNALDEAFVLLDFCATGNFYASVSNAYALLKTSTAECGEPLNASILAVGHTHIDVAWLWTLDQTRQKVGRSFRTVANLLEEYPDFVFAQSQAQLYDFVKNGYPELFDKIKEFVAQGRWEPVGRMWVESDCNLTGAESLVRQFMLGTRFFEQHFGENCQSSVMWLPDTFGFTWSLPQIARQFGIKYFFTAKIGWNKYNKLPYDTFWWQGIDGSRLLTHIGTTTEANADYGAITTYNGDCTANQVWNTWASYKQKSTNQTLLMPFGHGDGGGGPTRQMLDNRRVMEVFPSLPKVRNGSAEDFFKTLESCAESFPAWNDELYLEFHRGTYTTQARNKKTNRKCEFLLHNLEFLVTVAAVMHKNYAVPHKHIEDAWKLLCLNQFHDILPGSSVQKVYLDSSSQYQEIENIVECTQTEAVTSFCEYSENKLLLVNANSFETDSVVFCENEIPLHKSLQLSDGSPIEIQPLEHGTLFDPGKLPPYSITEIVIKGTEIQENPAILAANPHILENFLIRVEINELGDISRIYDKINAREILAPDCVGGQIQAFEDLPITPDAWDIEIYYSDKQFLSEPATSIRVVEAGPLRGTIEIKRKILNSTYTLKLSLGHNSPLLQFDLTIDWKEKHTLIKTAFPVDIFTKNATYEIQWGQIQRPTHQNTSWDWARFEVPAHKWVDISEGDYGVSLINDCKYGHDVRDNVLRMTLLRSTTCPDPNADEGIHNIKFSLLPHKGMLGMETKASAYLFNNPVRVFCNMGFAEPALENQCSINHLPLFSVDRDNLIIETIKPAEDGIGIIVRLYESQQMRGRARLSTFFRIGQAWKSNLMENKIEKLNTIDNRQIEFQFKPFEILTFHIVTQVD